MIGDIGKERNTPMAQALRPNCKVESLCRAEKEHARSQIWKQTPYDHTIHNETIYWKGNNRKVNDEKSRMYLLHFQIRCIAQTPCASQTLEPEEAKTALGQRKRPHINLFWYLGQGNKHEKNAWLMIFIPHCGLCSHDFPSLDFPHLYCLV